MAQFFYDGQIRRYITQVMRLMSNFYVSDSDGDLRAIPVLYGDLNRQVAHILKENSENKLPSAPRISVYITDLQIDRSRTADSSYVNKLQIRERKYDEESLSYSNEQGKSFSVERLMPSPYTLTCNVDIWTTNTTQKLQVMEQILIWFNPSLEIQTSDNPIDWTSISVVNLENIQFSSRSIPVGTESEMDIATLSFSLPIYISPPAKVKRLGMITNIISSVFDETLGTIETGMSRPDLLRNDGSSIPGSTTIGGDNKITTTADSDRVVGVNYNNYGVFVDGDSVKIIRNNTIGKVNWREVLEVHPGNYIPGVGQIFLTNADTDITIVGNITLDELDNSILNVAWDIDSFPSDSIINGPSGPKTSVNYILDPKRQSPANIKQTGVRVLLLDDVGSEQNSDGPSAWKNTNGSDLIAKKYDIIEWDGSFWVIVFEAASETDVKFVTNLNTNVQYRFNSGEWVLSTDGEYTPGTWRLNLYG